MADNQETKMGEKLTAAKITALRSMADLGGIIPAMHPLTVVQSVEELSTAGLAKYVGAGLYIITPAGRAALDQNGGER